MSRDFSANKQCQCRLGRSTILEICLNYSQHNESLKCERLKAQKIRRRPESCHGFHPEVSLITHPVLFPPQTCHGNFIIAKKFTREKTIPFRRIKEASTGRLLAPCSQPQCLRSLGQQPVLMPMIYFTSLLPIFSVMEGLSFYYFLLLHKKWL